jgi:hypothetical protein
MSPRLSRPAADLMMRPSLAWHDSSLAGRFGGDGRRPLSKRRQDRVSSVNCSLVAWDRVAYVSTTLPHTFAGFQNPLASAVG